MSDNAEIHSKILSFLAGEIARKEGRQCVAVDLVFTPGGGFRDDEIRKWVRADSPDLFDNFVKLDELVSAIIEIAENEADAKTPGRHRFEVRTHQHLGGRARQSFVLSPSYNGGDELSLVPTNGARQDATAATVLMNHAGQLMRTNAQIFDGTIRVLAATNSDMRRENAELHAENILLRREVDEARSNKMDREFDIAMQAEKNARTNAGFQKLMQLGTVVAAKIGGNENQPGEQTPVGMLIGEFGKSLRKDQIDVLMNTLDMAQKIMFFEIMNMVSPEQSKPNTGPASLPSSSGNGSSSP
jgi:hypothetical protein